MRCAARNETLTDLVGRFELAAPEGSSPGDCVSWATIGWRFRFEDWQPSFGAGRCPGGNNAPLRLTQRLRRHHAKTLPYEVTAINSARLTLARCLASRAPETLRGPGLGPAATYARVNKAFLLYTSPQALSVTGAAAIVLAAAVVFALVALAARSPWYLLPSGVLGLFAAGGFVAAGRRSRQ